MRHATKMILMTILSVAIATSANAVPKMKAKGLKRHALVKTAMAVGVVAKNAPAVAAKGVKYTIGSVLFVVEAGNDVLLAGLDAASDVAAKELKFNPVYYVYYVDDKVDHGLEFVEEYFFGVQNP